MDKVWAQRAGLGWLGKHTNLITRDHGSWLFLGELILDIDLDYDSPFDDDLCGSCTACIDACPTQALDEYQIDAGKCISYLTIEHRGDLPADQNNLHGWIYGCDICQDVCPWNEKFSENSEIPEFQAREEILSWTNKDWQELDEDGFRKLFKGSAVKRTKFVGLKRNIENNS
jgi:epoxyqueuosine reductase